MRAPLARGPRVPLAVALLFLVLLVACQSPRRGEWRGSFDGTVSGTVEMTVNARGTKCRGSMTGKTSDGQPFEAELDGILRQDYLSADFRGRTGLGGGLPVSFRGSLSGFLGVEEGEGEWQASLAANSYPMTGTFELVRTGESVESGDP